METYCIIGTTRVAKILGRMHHTPNLFHLYFFYSKIDLDFETKLGNFSLVTYYSMCFEKQMIGTVCKELSFLEIKQLLNLIGTNVRPPLQTKHRLTVSYPHNDKAGVENQCHGH